jgi:hypothetical protein
MAESLNATYALAAHEQVRVAGAVSWSFEFEDQPYFEGFRELATNGLDKPVLNAFRMFGLLGSDRVRVSNTGALPTEQVASSGVRQQPDIGAIAKRKNQEVEIMIWNYHDEDAQQRVHGLEGNGIAAVSFPRPIRTVATRWTIATTHFAGMDSDRARPNAFAIHPATARLVPRAHYQVMPAFFAI